MAKEILVVPEVHLADVIRVIRAGLTELYERRRDDPVIPATVYIGLTGWCDEEEAYLERFKGEQ